LPPFTHPEEETLKSVVFAAVVSAFVLGSVTAPASASPLAPRPVLGPSATANVYYYHGHYYPYRYKGHYYRYHQNGHYYDHRRRMNGRWNYY
jgi:hypothetical protein